MEESPKDSHADHDAVQASRVWRLFGDVAEGEWFAGERAATVAGIRAAVTREREAVVA